MGATIFDTGAFPVRSLATLLATLLGGVGGLLGFVVLVGLFLDLVGTTTRAGPLFGEGHEVVNSAARADTSHEPVICDESIVCAPNSVLIATENLLGDRLGSFQVASTEQPFPRFLSPQVDLPPPRGAA